MTPETASVTIKNPRWWLTLPFLLLAMIAFMGIGRVIYRPLWWVGQTLCRLSNAVSPHSATPRPIKTALEWVRRGART